MIKEKKIQQHVVVRKKIDRNREKKKTAKFEMRKKKINGKITKQLVNTNKIIANKKNGDKDQHTIEVLFELSLASNKSTPLLLSKELALLLLLLTNEYHRYYYQQINGHHFQYKIIQTCQITKTY